MVAACRLFYRQNATSFSLLLFEWAFPGHKFVLHMGSQWNGKRTLETWMVNLDRSCCWCMFLNRFVCRAPCPGTTNFCGATRQIWRKWNETYEEHQIWMRNKLWQGRDLIGLFHENMSVHPVGMRDYARPLWRSLTIIDYASVTAKLQSSSYESYAIAICRVRVRGTMGHRPCQADLWSRWSKEIKAQIAAKQKKREHRSKETKQRNSKYTCIYISYDDN